MKPFVTLLAIFIASSAFGQLLAPSQKAIAESIAKSHIDANVPEAADFTKLLDRDVSAFLTQKVGMKVKVECELLRDAPTQTGISYPKYYAWVRAVAEDQRTIAEGAMCLAAIDKIRFEVRSFVAKEEIVGNPSLIEGIFPNLLVPKVREKAGI